MMWYSFVEIYICSHLSLFLDIGKAIGKKKTCPIRIGIKENRANKEKKTNSFSFFIPTLCGKNTNLSVVVTPVLSLSRAAITWNVTKLYGKGKKENTLWLHIDISSRWYTFFCLKFNRISYWHHTSSDKTSKCKFEQLLLSNILLVSFAVAKLIMSTKTYLSQSQKAWGEKTRMEKKISSIQKLKYNRQLLKW